MALSPLRWIALFVAGCLIVVILSAGQDDEQRRVVDQSDLFAARVWSAASRANAAAGRLHLARIIDSARIGLPPANRDTRIRVVTDGGVPTAFRPTLDTLAARATRAIGDSGRIGLDVYFLYDTARVARNASLRAGGVFVDYILPSSATDRCTVIAHVSISSLAELGGAALGRTRNAADRLLGPCRFYHAFGQPGPAVAAWLREGALLMTGDGSWQSQSPRVNINVNVNNAFGGGADAIPSLIAPFAIVESTIPYFYELSPAAIQCAAGVASRCDGLTRSRRNDNLVTVWRNDILFEQFPGIDRHWNWRREVSLNSRYEGDAGHRDVFVLSDMVVTLGRQRFGDFWRSNEPVAAAFELAAGERLATWSGRWLRDTFGTPPARGPSPGLVGALATGLVAALCLLISMRSTERRQFI